MVLKEGNIGHFIGVTVPWLHANPVLILL